MTERLVSPFVTNVLIRIAQFEAKQHYEYRRGMDHAENEEQKTQLGILAIEHGRAAQFFGTLAQVRLLTHQQEPPDAATA